MPTKKAIGRPRGRPTKKNPEALARILEVARTGLPLNLRRRPGISLMMRWLLGNNGIRSLPGI